LQPISTPKPYRTSTATAFFMRSADAPTHVEYPEGFGALDSRSFPVNFDSRMVKQSALLFGMAAPSLSTI